MLSTWHAIPLADSAVHIEIGRSPSPDIQARTRALARAISEAKLPGVIDHLPSYAAVLLRYDPDKTDYASVVERVATLIESSSSADAHAQHWRVPACYDPRVAQDIAEAADLLGLSTDALVAAHTGARFEIALYGFAPGWAYLNGCPDALSLPRRKQPRPPTPDDALMIAGGQAMLTARSMPTGWYVIGRSAQPPLALEADPPVCFDVGDTLQFEAVSFDDWCALYARAQAGERVATPA